MAKKITEMGYEATAVVCGKFFDLDNVMAPEEVAPKFGYEYDDEFRQERRQLEELFNRHGLEFVGCVVLKKKFEDRDVGFFWGELVKNKEDGSLFIIDEVWDDGYSTLKQGSYNYSVLEQC